MSTINGYEIQTPWHLGNVKYTFAKKEGEDFFIKELVSPRYPVSGSASIRKDRIEKCREFEKSRKQVMDALKKSALPNGNILYPVDLFRQGAFYYEVSYRAKGEKLDFISINTFTKEQKLLLLKTITASLKILEKSGVVYGDMKPENIYVFFDHKASSLRGQVCDLTDSYLERKPGKRDEVIGTTPYYSPELGKYIVESGKLDFLKLGEKSITTKSDIFSTGIVFHQYLTAGKWPGIPEKYNYIYEAVLDDYKPLIDPSIDPEIAYILQAMLAKKSTDRPSASEVLNLLNNIV